MRIRVGDAAENGVVVEQALKSAEVDACRKQE